MEALELPAAASNARSMATRLEYVASDIRAAGVKPIEMRVGPAYLYGLRVNAFGNPPHAEDAVTVQVAAGDFVRLADRWHLAVEDNSLEMNRYASGLLDGVAVVVFSGRRQ